MRGGGAILVPLVEHAEDQLGRSRAVVYYPDCRLVKPSQSSLRLHGIPATVGYHPQASAAAFSGSKNRSSEREALTARLSGCKKAFALLAIFVLFQTEVKSQGIPVTPIKRGAFTTFDGCKASALAWARTLDLGKGNQLLELNNGYLVRADRRTVQLHCSRQGGGQP
jgi:hypothetical protein